MPTILGFFFGREFLFGGGLKPWKNKAEEFAENFAIKSRWKIRRQF